MRKVTSMDKIKRHVSNVKNGYTNGGGDNPYEREPLLTNPGVIGGKCTTEMQIKVCMSC